jgi:GNAT superfamily N-acetyltransferase
VDALQFHMTDEPADADWQWLEGNINQFNMFLTGYQDYRPLAVFLRDPAGAIIAGLTAFTWGGTLRIVVLWVDENWRGHGYGSQLLAAAEREALTRGCEQAILDTHSFQAPQFYSKRGYTVCGIIQDYPVGYQQFVFQKPLRAIINEAVGQYFG